MTKAELQEQAKSLGIKFQENDTVENLTLMIKGKAHDTIAEAHETLCSEHEALKAEHAVLGESYEQVSKENAELSEARSTGRLIRKFKQGGKEYSLIGENLIVPRAWCGQGLAGFKGGKIATAEAAKNKELRAVLVERGVAQLVESNKSE